MTSRGKFWGGQAKFLGGSGPPWHPPSSAPAFSTTKQSSIPAIQEQLTTSSSLENIYDEVTRIIIDFDECSTY